MTATTAFLATAMARSAIAERKIGLQNQSQAEIIRKHPPSPSHQKSKN